MWVGGYFEWKIVRVLFWFIRQRLLLAETLKSKKLDASAAREYVKDFIEEVRKRLGVARPAPTRSPSADPGGVAPGPSMGPPPSAGPGASDFIPPSTGSAAEERGSARGGGGFSSGGGGTGGPQQEGHQDTAQEEVVNPMKVLWERAERHDPLFALLETKEKKEMYFWLRLVQANPDIFDPVTDVDLSELLS